MTESKRKKAIEKVKENQGMRKRVRKIEKKSEKKGID